MKKKSVYSTLILAISLLLMCGLLSGCSNESTDSGVSEEKESSAWEEEKLIVEADKVSVSKEDYQKVDELKGFLRETLIENPNEEVIKNLKKQAAEVNRGDSIQKKNWDFYLSCVPIISWGYEKNEIDDTNCGLFMFDKKMKNGFFMHLADSVWEKELEFNGFYTTDLKWMQAKYSPKYIFTKADHYFSCFVGADNRAYWDDGSVADADVIEIKGDYYGKFDADRIGVTIEELTDPSNCISFDLSDERKTMNAEIYKDKTELSQQKKQSDTIVYAIGLCGVLLVVMGKRLYRKRKSSQF